MDMTKLWFCCGMSNSLCPPDSTFLATSKFTTSMSNSLYPTDSTFLATSHFTTSMHWPCYYTLSFIFVIVVWSFWMKVNLCVIFLLFACICFYHWESNYQEGVGWDPIELWNNISLKVELCLHTRIIFVVIFNSIYKRGTWGI
jgi:hypothetical protein